MAIVPYNNRENRVAINPPQGLQATGAELGWRASAGLAHGVTRVLQGPNPPTSLVGRIGSGLVDRASAVGVNTVAPLFLGLGCFALRTRAMAGFGVNASGVLSHTVQVFDPQTDQRAAHVAEIFKLSYRGCIDAATFGINFVHPDAASCLIVAEGAALLIAPDLLRSVSKRVFGTIDALVEGSVSRIAGLFGASAPVVRVPITNDQRKQIRDSEGNVAFEFTQGNDGEVTMRVVLDGSVTDHLEGSSRRAPRVRKDAASPLRIEEGRAAAAAASSSSASAAASAGDSVENNSDVRRRPDSSGSARRRKRKRSDESSASAAAAAAASSSSASAVTSTSTSRDSSEEASAVGRRSSDEPSAPGTGRSYFTVRLPTKKGRTASWR